METKAVLNLTKRRLVCFIGGALVGVSLFFLLKGLAGFSAGAASLCMVLVMLPFFLTAVYENNGLPMEKIVRSIFRVLFFQPKQRPYQTENLYAVLARQRKLDKETYRIVGKKAKPTAGRSLSRAERRQVEAAVARARQTDKKKQTAQDSIPFERMFPGGICRVTDSYYTKTVQLQYINYHLNQNEDIIAIFEGWCDFFNYFDSSIRFQLSLFNLSATRDSFAKNVTIPPQGDDFDSLRSEYTEMLRNQLPV